MLTDIDKFVIEVALENQLIAKDVAEQLRTLCTEHDTRALDLMRENQLISESYLQALADEVQRQFGQRPQISSTPIPQQRRSDGGRKVPAGNIRYEHLHDLIDVAWSMKASDLHVGAGYPPVVRINGTLHWFDSPPLTAAEAERVVFSILSNDLKEEIAQNWQADFSYENDKKQRFRVCVVRQRLGYNIVLRLINRTVPSFESLGLPEHLKSFTEYNQGLVLVTGAVGTGKSTTMAALLEVVNQRRRDHIVTLEDPIEYVFEPKNCQITQREIPTHSKSFGTALRAALREDPDVIMVGEMRDLETVSLAITAAETGHLVFGTLHTNNAARTIDRVLDVFPGDQQGQIRTMISESLKGIISQQLIPSADGKSRVLALEILANNPAIRACVLDNKTFLIPGIMQTGKKLGMKLMDDALMELLKAGKITGKEAYERAEIKGPFALYAEQGE